MSATILPSPNGGKIMFPKTQTLIYESPPLIKSPDLQCEKHQLKL